MMKVSRVSRSAAVAAMAMVAAGACATTGTGPTVTVSPIDPQAANFSWQADRQANPAPFAIGILRPSYEFDGVNSPVEADLTSRFVSSLATDLEGALISKGYTVSGTYDDLSIMTFGERQGAMLVLQPEIRLGLARSGAGQRDVHWDSPATSGDPGELEGGVLEVSQRAENVGAALVALATGVNFDSPIRKLENSGMYRVEGRIDLRLLEPVTGELMWVRSIDLPTEGVDYRYYSWHRMGENGQRSGEEHVLEAFDGRQAALTSLLSQAYGEVFQAFDRYFDPRELAAIRQDAQEVRRLRRY